MNQLSFTETLNEIKKKTTLRQVIESYGIKVSGNKLITCPFHDDSTPSLKVYSVDSDDGSWYCFAKCGGGDLLNFVQKYENKNAIEALNSLCVRLGINPVTHESENAFMNSLENTLNPKSAKKSDLSKMIGASILAKKEYENLSTQNLTKYMIDKRISHVRTKSSGNLLVVPVCDEDENIWSLQYIAPNGAKWFMDEGKRVGCMFKLGPEPTNIVFVCEGYSTGYSVYTSTGITTYISFSASNIRNVVETLQYKYPQTKVVICGDNDSPGKSHRILSAVYPDRPGEDWNDVFLKEGPIEVKKKIFGGIGEKV